MPPLGEDPIRNGKLAARGIAWDRHLRQLAFKPYKLIAGVRFETVDARQHLPTFTAR